MAWHEGAGALRLGADWDADEGFGPGADDARSDDGVTRGAWTAVAGAVTVTVNGGAGYVAGWFDWNEDGDFADAGELAFSNAAFSAGETREVTFDASTRVFGKTIAARFRVYAEPQSGLAAAEESPLPFGAAGAGEVEDYAWYFDPLAVSLVDFTGETALAGVQLRWSAQSSADLLGFNLYRRAAPAASNASEAEAAWTRLNPALIPAAEPGSANLHEYGWLDETAVRGATYLYRLDGVNRAGATVDSRSLSVVHPPLRLRWLPLVP